MEAFPDAVVAGLVPDTPIAVLSARRPKARSPVREDRGRRDKPGDDGSM
jgi:hypothetical protein